MEAAECAVVIAGFFFSLKILLIVLIYVWWLLELGRAFSMYWGCLSQKEKYFDVRGGDS
jgi:hypothetical protein